MSAINEENHKVLKEVANRLRIHSINSTNASKSGHPTSCCSAAEIVAVLFFHEMRYTTKFPRDPASDRFVLSKGHAAPVLYAAWAEAGLFPASELMNLRKIDNDLEGHPTPRLNFIDVATGSLGQGLGYACGMAYSGKYFEKSDFRVYCLLGDGETSEGSVWEAAAFASHYKLDNLVAIIDVNRLGQSDPAPLQHDIETYRKRFDAFGWNAIPVDGHDIVDVVKAFVNAKETKAKPTCIIAKTFKGKGIPGIEDELNWHGKPLAAETEKALAAINGLLTEPLDKSLNIQRQPITSTVPQVSIGNVKLNQPPAYSLGEKVATRAAYGVGLSKLDHPRVVALDGDTKNSTFSDKFMKVHPDRFIECYIAEQNVVGVGIGCATRDRNIVFCSMFAAFFSRAYDQIRMGAISQTNVNFCGSHVGVSIGEDGPSQMALEDLSMFRAIPGSTVFYPSDAVSMERAVELAANTKGICFIRSGRPALPVIYGNEEPFAVGKAKVVKSSDSDVVTVIGANITLYEALSAHDQLAKEGINIRVVDPFTIKPLDSDTIVGCAKATGGKIVVVEDHYPEGGIGEAVSMAIAPHPGMTMKHLAVRGVPRSGPSAALLDMFGVSARHIVEAVKSM